MDLTSRAEYESRFKRRLLRISSGKQDELIKQLGTPPSLANVSAGFWTSLDNDVEREMAALLVMIWMAAMQQHGVEPRAGSSGESWARNRAAEFGSQYVRRTREMVSNAISSATLKDKQDKLTTLLGPEEITPDDLWNTDIDLSEAIRRAVDSAFGDARAEAIAITETTAAVSVAVMSLGRMLLARNPSTRIYWRLGGCNHCKTCLEVSNTEAAVWSVMFPSGPPAHPRCCCWLDVYSDDSSVPPSFIW